MSEIGDDTFGENDSSQSSTDPFKDVDSIEIKDPYLYINRNDFTSEVYKIEIKNLPPHLCYVQFKQLLKKLDLKPHKIKPMGSPATHAFVTFKCEVDRQYALTRLNNHTWKGKQLTAKLASPMADPLVSKRNLGEAEDSRAPKRKKTEEDNLPVQELLTKAICPLSTMPYSEQLALKSDNMTQFLTRLGRSISKHNPSLGRWLFSQREEGNKLCCTLESIQPSPVTEDYRNKCEFSVGLHRDSLLPTVGFRLSSYRQGSMSVAEPVDCWIVPPAMTKLAATFQEYIRQNSQLEVFNPETYQGYWRGLTARTSRGGDLLVIVVMHPQSLSEEDIDAEKKKLKEYFECGSGKKCGVTSLWLHLFDKRRAEGEQEHSLFHLSGNKGLTEELLGLKFHVAPEAFFQVNTAGAEVLYNQVGKLLEVGPSTVVLDICCGTGTIGLSLAKHVQRVIGIELCSQAVQNAKLNAQVNEVTNAQFVCGRAEDSIYNVLQAVPASSEAVAILDPPRAGLNNKVVKALRGCTQLNKLVYIACNPAGALNNMVDLCRATSKSYRGEPFYPVKAVPVDLFPHTQHCELAVLFQRRSPQ